MTGQEKDDLLIQVTAWPGLTVVYVEDLFYSLLTLSMIKSLLAFRQFNIIMP